MSFIECKNKKKKITISCYREKTMWLPEVASKREKYITLMEG